MCVCVFFFRPIRSDPSYTHTHTHTHTSSPAVWHPAARTRLSPEEPNHPHIARKEAAMSSPGDAAAQIAALLNALTQPDTNAIRSAEVALKPLLKDARSVPALVEVLKGRGIQVRRKDWMTRNSPTVLAESPPTGWNPPWLAAGTTT